MMEIRFYYIRILNSIRIINFIRIFDNVFYFIKILIGF